MVYCCSAKLDLLLSHGQTQVITCTGLKRKQHWFHTRKIETFNPLSLLVKKIIARLCPISKNRIDDVVSTYIMSVFTNKSAYYVGLVLASTSQRDENFYFQFQFTNILPGVCFIAFFSKLTIDTVLSLKRFSRRIVMIKMWPDLVNFRI